MYVKLMKILSTQYSTMMIFALIVSVGLILSTTVVSANAEVQNNNDVKVQQKKDTKHVTVVKKTVKKTETKTAPKPAAPAPAPVTTPAPVDPLQEKLDACKTKETPREQYECQKAAKAGAGGSEFKAKATATDRKSTRLNSSHSQQSRMPSSA